MSKYLKLFATHFSTALEYRANLVGTLILDALSTGGVLVLWVAVYRTHTSVAGYDFSQALLYYLLIPFVSFFTRVDISQKLGEEIRKGTFSNYLLRPYRFWVAMLMNVLAEKINMLLLGLVVYTGIFALLLNKGLVSVGLADVALAFAAAMGAFALHFAMDLTLAFAAFWMDDVWAFRHIKNICFGVFGGMNFPLDFLPHTLRAVADVLPFQYFYYIPLSYLLDKQNGASLLPFHFGMMALWAMVFVLIGTLVWNVGLKKYGAYGH